tara:strand:+ start:295 stop:396 length:102 start_codon:yes stop_codon:yes gene_type:complete
MKVEATFVFVGRLQETRRVGREMGFHNRYFLLS